LQAIAGLPVRSVEADSGNAAIRAINRNKPALMILDICMPYPDGLTLLKMIRQDSEFEDLPVIICSVENGLMERAEAETFGISGFPHQTDRPQAPEGDGDSHARSQE
jgi:CheY-like chemotaxis protein